MNNKKYYAEIGKKITEKGGIILRGDDEKIISDLDIYCSKSNKNNVKLLLESEGFILVKCNTFYEHYKKIVENKVVFIDITKSFGYIFLKLGKTISFKNDYLKEFLNKPKEKYYYTSMKSIRYLFEFKNKDKHKSFMRNQKAYISDNKFFFDVLNVCPPFKKKLIYSDVEKFMDKDFFTLKKYIGIIGYFQVIKNRITIKFSDYKIGKSICFLGIDGVGKSTIVDILAKEMGYKKVYLGAGEYRMKRICDTYLKSNIILKLISKLILYIELSLKYFYVIAIQISGRNVVIDRHPYYDSIGNTYSSKLEKYLYHIVYKYFYLRPTKVIVLYEDADVILKRKNESTKEKIENFYGKLEKKLINKPDKYFWIKNTTIDSTLNQILKIIYD